MIFSLICNVMINVKHILVIQILEIIENFKMLESFIPFYLERKYQYHH